LTGKIFSLEKQAEVVTWVSVPVFGERLKILEPILTVVVRADLELVLNSQRLLGESQPVV
jgi:hypothetical protein